jgi:hypothetical protein
MESKLREKGLLLLSNDNSDSDYNKILEALKNELDKTLSSETELGHALYVLMKDSCNKRGSIFEEIPPSFDEKGAKGDTIVVAQMLKWFSSSVLEKTFYEINVDSSLTEDNLIQYFDRIQVMAKKMLTSKALVVVFLDGKWSI